MKLIMHLLYVPAVILVFTWGKCNLISTPMPVHRYFISFICNHEKLETTNVHQLVSGYTGTLLSRKKKEKFTDILKTWIIHKCIVQNEEARQRRLHFVWFHLCGILEKGNIEIKSRSVIGRRNWLKSSAQGHFGEWWNYMYPDCVMITYLYAFSEHINAYSNLYMFELYYMYILSVI